MNGWLRHVVMVAAVMACAWTLAWELRIDDSAGPADLGERVDAAVAAWSAVGIDIEAVERTVLVRYASAELLGPDALSLVVTGGPPGVDLEVLVRADAGDRLDDALVVALGIALGGSPGVGILDPRLKPDEARVPSDDDATAVAPALRVTGDITGDGRVGFDDLLALAESWGRRGVNLPADLDRDGVVDDADLTLLRERYRFAALGDEIDDSIDGEIDGEIDGDEIDEPDEPDPAAPSEAMVDEERDAAAPDATTPDDEAAADEGPARDDGDEPEDDLPEHDLPEGITPDDDARERLSP